MKKYIWIIILITIIIWLAIASYWTGISPEKSKYLKEETLPQVPETTPSPEIASSSAGQPIELNISTSSSVILVAPTVSVDFKY